MFKSILKNNWVVYLVIFTIVIVYYLPILVNPDLALNRNNDLTEFFWPIFNYVKNHLATDGVIPLWNTLFLAGTPLLPDPQSPIYYLPNIIALILPLNLFFLTSFILHSTIAGVGMFLLSKDGFKFTKRTSFLLTVLYTTTPKLAGYLETGHIGLIYSYAWIPFIILSVIKIVKAPKIYDSIILGGSLALLYYSHLPTLIVLTASLTMIFLSAIIFKFVSISRKTFLFLIVGGVIALGLTAISLLPQMEAQSSSTRYLLLKNPDVYPKWNSIFEPLKIAVVPWVNGVSRLQKIDTEKWIAVGVFTTLLALYGFFKLQKKFQISILILIAILSLIILNNASPISSVLFGQKWYLLLRVSSRFWIIIQFIILYLSGIAIESVQIHKNKSLIYLVTLFAIIESVFLGWSYLSKPITKNANLAPKEVYEYLNKDKSLFRVFCLTRCLSQKDSSIYNLQLLDGYSTLQLRNFNEESWQLTGSYWNYYTLSIPPIGTYMLEKLKPDPKSLGEFNVKYIISPYSLANSNLDFIKSVGGFYIYQNRSFLPRAYYYMTSGNVGVIPISNYSPNFIKLDVSNIQAKQIILSEVYSTGWKAYLDGVETPIMQRPNTLRAVDIKPLTKSVYFAYNPDSYLFGKWVTTLTLLLILTSTIIIVTKKGWFKSAKLYSKYVVLVFLGILCSLLVIECSMRLLFFLSQSQILGLKPQRITLEYYNNPIFGNALKQNQTGWFVTPSHEYANEVKTNNDGWPDVYHTKEKPKGVYRILILGDSFVENFQVPFEQRFFRQLQEKLGKKVEIIALGKGNTGTSQQYLILKNYGLSYHPDLVIQMFLTANDVKNNSHELQKDSSVPYFNLDKNGSLTLVPQAPPENNFLYKIKEMAKRSRLVEQALWIRQELQDANVSKVNGGYPIDYGVYLKNDTPDYKQAWKVTKRMIIESKKETEKSGAKYIFVSLSNNEQANNDVWKKVLDTYPNIKTLETDLNKPDKILNDFCIKENLRCYFMNPFFEEYIKNNPGTRTHFFYDGHWNQTGTNLATQFLYDTVLKPYLIRR